MKRTEATFLSSDESHSLYYTVFLPEENPVALLQVCHDGGEHMEHYLPLAEYLTGQGIILCGCDIRGHGRSIPQGEEPGNIGQGRALDTLIEDQKRLYDLMRKKYRYLPYLLLGQGLGAEVLQRWMALYKESGDGMILSCPDVLRLSPVLGKLTFFLSCRGKKKDQPAAALEKKLYGCKKTAASPEGEGGALPCGFPLTADAYRQIFESGIITSDPLWATSIEQGLPVMVFSGEEQEGAKMLSDRLLDAEICMQSLRLFDSPASRLFSGEKREEVFFEVEKFILQVAEGVREARMGTFYQ